MGPMRFNGMQPALVATWPEFSTTPASLPPCSDPQHIPCSEPQLNQPHPQAKQRASATQDTALHLPTPYQNWFVSVDRDSMMTAVYLHILEMPTPNEKEGQLLPAFQPVPLHVAAGRP